MTKYRIFTLMNSSETDSLVLQNALDSLVAAGWHPISIAPIGNTVMVLASNPNKEQPNAN